MAQQGNVYTVFLVVLSVTFAITLAPAYRVQRIPFGDQISLHCSVGSGVPVYWTKDGAPYAHANYQMALLEPASAQLNGSVFQCFAEGNPVPMITWEVIVERPSRILSTIVNDEGDVFAVRWELSETSDADNTQYLLSVQETNFSAKVNETHFSFPASVCLSDLCTSCIATMYANNSFGRGPVIDVVLRPAVGCDNIEMKALEMNDSTATAAIITTITHKLSPTTPSGVSSGVVIVAVVIGTAVIVAVLIMICVSFCCYRRRKSRKTELNPTAPSGSGESSTVVIRDPVSEVDHSRDSNTPVGQAKLDETAEIVRKCSQHRTEMLPRSSTRRDDDSCSWNVGDGSEEAMQKSQDTLPFTAENDVPIIADLPAHCTSTPLRHFNATSPSENSADPLIGSNSTCAYSRQESNQEQSGDSLHVFHKVSSTTSFVNLEGALVQMNTDNAPISV